MEFYRLKHKPTGLYYRPGQTANLTKKGKVYTSGGNALNYFTHGVPVRAGKALADNLRQFYLNIPEVKYGLTEVVIPKSDFVIEPFNQTI